MMGVQPGAILRLYDIKMLWLPQDVVGSIPGPDTCDRQCLGHELHWWHYSQKCVGLVCPPQLPSPD